MRKETYFEEQERKRRQQAATGWRLVFLFAVELFALAGCSGLTWAMVSVGMVWFVALPLAAALSYSLYYAFRLFLYWIALQAQAWVKKAEASQ